MPACYTHYSVAWETLRLFPSQLQRKIQPHLPLYFFGAQGADFCFFYPVLGGFSQNLGSYLHRRGGFSAFNVCRSFSAQAPLLAYSLGYVTHYAADVVFHPFIYEKTGKSPLLHTRLENALDKHFKERTKNQAETNAYFRVKLSKKDKHELFLLYAAICAKIGFPPLAQQAFFRAIALFNAYLPPSSTILSIKSAALIRKVSHQADALYEQAVAYSETLCNTFYECVKKKIPLSCEIFGKNYVTGKLETL